MICYILSDLILSYLSDLMSSSHSYLNSSLATLASDQTHAPLKALVLLLPFPHTALCPNYHLSPSFYENLSSNITSSERTHIHFISYALSYFLFKVLNVTWNHIAFVDYHLSPSLELSFMKASTLFYSPMYLQHFDSGIRHIDLA